VHIGVEVFPQGSILNGWCPLPEYWLAKSLSKVFYVSIDDVVLEVRIWWFIGGITLPSAIVEAFEISSLDGIGPIKARQCPIRQNHIKELFVAFEKYIESVFVIWHKRRFMANFQQSAIHKVLSLGGHDCC
jgi:hypothetical protein